MVSRVCARVAGGAGRASALTSCTTTRRRCGTRRPEGRFVAIEEPETHVPVEARAEILRRYLAAFGPASRRDIVAWAMMHVPEVQRALDLLDRYAASATSTAANFSTSRGHRCRTPTRPRPFGSCRSGTTCSSRFADRTRVLPEPYRKVVIGMNGDVAQTFLVDGFVAGMWRVENGRVVCEPFSPLPRSVQREVEEEAERLETFLAD